MGGVFCFVARAAAQMRRRQRQFVKIMLVALLTLPAPATLNAASPGSEALKHFFNEVQTFEARFAQLVLDDNLQAIDEGHGTLWIKRPGRFRWDYAPPDPQEIVGDGERVWLYDIALEQVTVRDQAEALGRTPAILLAGVGDLAQTHRMEDLGTQGRLHWVSLTPKNAEPERNAGGFTEVRIGFEGRSLRLMELIDSLDQRTRIRFAENKENAPVADARFKFTPPDGVDIIDQTGE